MRFDEATLEELLSQDVESLRRDTIKRQGILSFYRLLFAQQPCANCKDKFRGYYDKLKAHGMTKLKQKNECDFELKDGVCVALTHGSEEMLSNHNITNDLSCRFLAHNKNRKQLFTKLPDDWEERVQACIDAPAEVVAEEEIVEEATQDQASDANFAELGKKNAKTLVKEIKAGSHDDYLNDLLAVELGSKNRKSVIDAIEARTT